MAKYKRLRRRKRRAGQWLLELSKRDPGLFARWRIISFWGGRHVACHVTRRKINPQNAHFGWVTAKRNGL